ncbi:transposase [Streptomyces swartbergensis]|uniref:transposase n=1 Tax=Streptomyces swartbergensis TaxID=487165 RepID=UPI0037F5444A
MLDFGESGRLGNAGDPAFDDIGVQGLTTATGAADQVAHWSRAMRAWVAEQDWLTLERLPAYAPELNPVELLWSSLKNRELANLAGDHLADVADATEQGIHRINANPRLPWSFLAHTGLTIHPAHPPNLRKDQ